MTTDAQAARAWSRPLRVIHLLLATAVTAQLWVGSLMRSPHPGRPDSLGFVWHECIGATILTLVIVHWAWSASHPDEGLRHLFPWTRAGMRNVLAEVRTAIFRQRLPPGGPGHAGGVAGFVHGLGLLAVTATVLIGGVYFFVRLAGASHAQLDVIEDFHDTFAVIVWVYWGGHLALTLLHSLLGTPVWKPMFGLGKPH